MIAIYRLIEKQQIYILFQLLQDARRRKQVCTQSPHPYISASLMLLHLLNAKQCNINNSGGQISYIDYIIET